MVAAVTLANRMKGSLSAILVKDAGYREPVQAA
jgi:hypothetical protein